MTGIASKKALIALTLGVAIAGIYILASGYQAMVSAESAGNVRSDAEVTTARMVDELSRGVVCWLCHDAEQTKEFHVPKSIIEIENAKNMRRRICIDCHGPAGANADKQMTNPSDITYDEDLREYRSPEAAHGIHLSRIGKTMNCQSCHIKDGKLVIPRADRGQVLVCENCKFHPEGNYITVHLEISGLQCTTCHTGDILAIHRRATAKLGTVE